MHQVAELSVFSSYPRFISQVRKTLLEDEEDDHGKPKKGKTPFVVLAKDVK